MQNIIDYVEEKGIFSFAEFPFTDVDSLILSQLAYWKFDGFVPSIDEEDRDITFLNLLEHENVSTLFSSVWDIPSNTALLKALAGSDRYGEVTLHYYVNDMDIAAQKQFSALTFQVGTAFLYLAFRGTDDSFVGWKEDFDMACETPVPSQLAGVKYLSDVAQKATGALVTGGHSKGGNIAEYAAVSCPKKTSSRIAAIYNHDAPGFHRAFYSSPRYMAVKDKIHKTVPQASLF
ncbi:MAG: Mbeg1-like protein, partial [Oscillospiraceae bacterium]